MRTQSMAAVDARTVPSEPSSLAIAEMPRKPLLPTSTVHSTFPGWYIVPPRPNRSRSASRHV